MFKDRIVLGIVLGAMLISAVFLYFSDTYRSDLHSETIELSGDYIEPVSLEPERKILKDRADSAICGIVVMERNREAVPGSAVTIRGFAGTDTLNTDHEGKFCFENLVPGNYSLSAREAELSSSPIANVFLGPDDVVDVILVLSRGTWVEGRVFSRKDHHGVGNARIMVRCPANLVAGWALSEEGGDFAVNNLAKGRYLLSVQAEGYAGAEMILELRDSRPMTGLTIILEPSALLSGRVEDFRGTPIEGASVRAIPYRLSDSPETFRVEGDGSWITDEKGRFEINSPPGLISVYASATGYGPGRATGIYVGSGESSEDIVIRLRPSSVLNISVVDMDGNSVRGASVTAYCDGHIICGSGIALTGEIRLETGSGTVIAEVASPDGRGRIRKTLDMPVSGERNIRVVMQSEGSITGLVVDNRDNPVPSASVLARNNSGGLIESTRTDSDGQFSISVPADYSVELYAEYGGALASKTSVRSGDDIRLVLDFPGSLSGYVTDSSGMPVSDFIVTLSGEDVRASFRKERFISENGDFIFSGLIPGNYNIIASAPGYGESGTEKVRIWGNEDAGPLRLSLPASGRIHGRVINSRGKAMSGVRVAINYSRLRGLGRWSGSDEGITETDSSGAFILEDIPAGSSHRVFAWHSHGVGAGMPVYVEAGKMAGPVEITLRPTRTSATEESFGGVGMSINESEGIIRVGEVYAGGPAHAAGLKAGDRIVSVDGIDTGLLGLQGTLSAIRGVVGTEVLLFLENRGTGYRARLIRVELQI